MICAKFGWNWPCGSGEEDENVKSLRHNNHNDNNDDDGQRTNFDQKGSLEPLAQLSQKQREILTIIA